MLTRTASLSLGYAALLLGVVTAGCAKQQAGTTSQIVDQTFALTPGSVAVRFGFLSGALKDLKVTERVEQGTDHVTDPPKLKGTLTLKNTSEDQTAQLVAAKIEYLDSAGQSIAPARSDTTVSRSSYQSDRLDPGAETSRDIDVPFPSAVLKAKNLADVRVKVVYLPSPYRAESMKAAVSLVK